VLIKSRLVAIHDDDIPSQLAKFQAVKISIVDPYGRPLPLKSDKRVEYADISLFDTTPIFAFFAALITKSRVKPLRDDLNDQNVRSLLRTHAQLVIGAFFRSEIQRNHRSSDFACRKMKMTIRRW
jgi:hypothetical protein